MACPTCDHTMHSLGQLVSGERYWWCPRCGTLKGDLSVPPVAAAMVSSRLKSFLAELAEDGAAVELGGHLATLSECVAFGVALETGGQNGQETP